jgi:hypothetical protein
MVKNLHNGSEKYLNFVFQSLSKLFKILIIGTKILYHFKNSSGHPDWQHISAHFQVSVVAPLCPQSFGKNIDPKRKKMCCCLLQQ